MVGKEKLLLQMGNISGKRRAGCEVLPLVIPACTHAGHLRPPQGDKHSLGLSPGGCQKAQSLSQPPQPPPRPEQPAPTECGQPDPEPCLWCWDTARVSHHDLPCGIMFWGYWMSCSKCFSSMQEHPSTPSSPCPPHLRVTAQGNAAGGTTRGRLARAKSNPQLPAGFQEQRKGWKIKDAGRETAALFLPLSFSSATDGAAWDGNKLRCSPVALGTARTGC